MVAVMLFSGCVLFFSSFELHCGMSSALIIWDCIRIIIVKSNLPRFRPHSFVTGYPKATRHTVTKCRQIFAVLKNAKLRNFHHGCRIQWKVKTKAKFLILSKKKLIILILFLTRNQFNLRCVQIVIHHADHPIFAPVLLDVRRHRVWFFTLFGLK